MSRALPPVIIPAPDYARLERLARAAWSDQHPTARFLLSEIRRARVVDDTVCRDDIVTLNRWVTYRLDLGRYESRILVHPEDYVSSEFQLSVLSPVGTALIGIKKGPDALLEHRESISRRHCRECRPPVKIVSFAQDARRVHINLEDEPFDPGPQAA